jgi:hypothetical protein
MKKYCDITDHCNDSISDSQQSISESVLECYTDSVTNLMCREFTLIKCVDGDESNPLIKNYVPDCVGCPNDETYFFLIAGTEILTLQFQFKNNFDTGAGLTCGWNLPDSGQVLIDAFLVDCCSGAETAISNYVYDNQHYVAKHAQILIGGTTWYKDTQGIKLNMNLVAVDCFYLKILVYQPDGSHNTYYTLPFKKTDCRHTDLCLIESTYTGIDSIGNIYSFDNNYDFIYPASHSFFMPTAKMLIRGEYLLISASYEKTYVNNFGKEIKSQLIRHYRLRPYPMSEDAIKYLLNVINGSDIIINNERVILDSNVEKETDIRKDWTPEIYFKEYSDQIDSGCG